MNLSGISSQTLAGRVLRLPLKMIPKNAVVPILQGRLQGKRWIVGAGDHGCWLGSFEYVKRQAFERLVPAGSVFFDVGANVGFYTLLAAELVGDAGQVVAFEPLPRNLEFLRRHVDLNCMSKVRIFEAALAATDGEAMFAEGETAATGRLGESGSIKVRTIRLDTLITEGELPVPDFMKIDVEGAELEVLHGAQELLRSAHPTIFLATHGPELHAACIAYLREHGYTISTLGGGAIESSDEILAISQIGGRT